MDKPSFDSEFHDVGKKPASTPSRNDIISKIVILVRLPAACLITLAFMLVVIPIELITFPIVFTYTAFSDRDACAAFLKLFPVVTRKWLNGTWHWALNPYAKFELSFEELIELTVDILVPSALGIAAIGVILCVAVFLISVALFHK
jgi:hypothetical protein